MSRKGMRILVVLLGGAGAVLGLVRGMLLVADYVVSGIMFEDLFAPVTLVTIGCEVIALLF